MIYRTVAHIIKGEPMQMGQTAIKQALPTVRVQQIDPFLLLHHFGPTTAEPGVDPLAVGPHPHRGFEPVTFLYCGGIRHRDSRDNTGWLNGGDVQWMTAGRGIIHSEMASPQFVENGGVMEGIQLWINLPKSHKMTQPDYQDIKSEQIPAWTSPDGLASLRVVAGQYRDIKGPARTFTPILALQVSLKEGGEIDIDLPADHNAFFYILDGNVQLNNNFSYSDATLIHLRNDGEGILLKGLAASRILVLSGQPIDEPVAQYGPFVMNTQTELLEAMRDYQMGKMGVYID
ncbi:MAG: pirin family protein [Saprospiraceae bacterium]|nr:pirin family protein [Saprospiraceae bacterium]